ncbi:MAG: hypothetical protein ACXVQ0_12525 [Actinomycetota bacterium]
MSKSVRVGPFRVVVALSVAVLAASAFMFGSALASGRDTPALPCRDGGTNCMSIGYSDAWLGGQTVQLEYSHRFFCMNPPANMANSHCEAGDGNVTPPPSGAVVSNMYVLVPLGFSPPGDTLHCPTAGRCIDQPGTIDVSRLIGWGSGNVVFPHHSIVLEENESFQSTWWPVVLVGVKNLTAWNQLAAAKSADAMDACETAGNCTQEFATNAFVFFQVLGPGMSPQGPA